MCLSELESFPFSAWLELVSSFLETLWLCTCNLLLWDLLPSFSQCFDAELWLCEVLDADCLDRHGKVVYMLAQANLAMV